LATIHRLTTVATRWQQAGRQYPFVRIEGHQMASLILAVAIGAMGDANFDPRSIPANERIAYVNKYATHPEGRSAREAYERAGESFYFMFNLNTGNKDDRYRRLVIDVERNLVHFALSEDWKLSYAKVIDRWLKRNARTLEALREATSYKWCDHSIPESKARYHRVNTNIGDMVSETMRLAKLLLVAANAAANREDWPLAYATNAQIHRLADHVSQSPAGVAEFWGDEIRTLANRQRLFFLNRHRVENLPELLAQVEVGRSTHYSKEVRERLGQLWFIDSIEEWHAWARDPVSYPDLNEEIKAIFEWREWRASEGIDSLLGKSPFATIEAVRAALQSSSVEKDWALNRRSDKSWDRWIDLPFDKAWAEREAFDREQSEIMTQVPAFGIYGDHWSISQLEGEHRVSLLYAEVVPLVVAIQDFQKKSGALPKQLTDVAKNPPIDPFTGKSLIYRVAEDGSSFTLYSVGGNTTDDGGVHSADGIENGDVVFWPPPVPVFVPSK
jgi:hypothetical protein